jgi:RNA polymerase sigma-70 factor (ECF subfamily)
MQMLYKARPKWRLRLSNSSESRNRGGITCLGAATVSSHVSEGQNRDTRKAARLTSGREPAQFSPTRSTSEQWTVVQEMFLVCRPRFIGLAYSIVRNKEDAEDAVQNAMLSAYLHLRSFEGRSAFTTWFTRILFNAALMIQRKRKPARIESFSDPDESSGTPWIERIPTARPDPEMVCAEAETFRAIDKLLGEMNPVLRQAFTIAYYQELSAKEAGALLGVTAGTFKARVYRARKHLIQQTQRSLVVPIRCATQTHFSSTARSVTASNPKELLSSEVVFG